MSNENQKFVDQLLAASIRHHSTLEPRGGLQGRILAGVAARQQSAHKRAWAWGLATAAFAAIVIAGRVARHSSSPTAQPAAIAITRSQPAALPAPNVPERAPVRRPHVSSTVAERPQQFPTPVPLSEQEKLLLLYVKETPKPVPAAPPATTEKDLEIPALNIAALDIKELPGSQTEK